jgi:hypothetical protein
MTDMREDRAIGLASYLLRTRRLRSEMLGEGLFDDPAWYILLDLFVARHQGREMGVSSVCIGSGVPSTTALRWIKVLEDRGMIGRRSDPGDGRRVLLALEPEAAMRVRDLLDDAFRELGRVCAP